MSLPISPDCLYANGLTDSLNSKDFHNLFDHIPEKKEAHEETLFKLFLNSNEGEQAKTLATLEKHPISEKVMLATSGFFALNIASIRGRAHQQHLDYLVLFDCSERVAQFWSFMQPIITSSSSPSEALDSIKTLLIKEASRFWPPANKIYSIEEPALHAEHSIAALEIEIKEGTSWLSSDKQFQVIKNIFDNNHFIFKRVNFCNQNAMAFFAKQMSNCALKLDTVYLSNIREYVEFAGTDQGLAPFHASLKELKIIATDQTFFIDTRPRLHGLAQLSDKEESPLEQRVINKFVSCNIEKSFSYSPLDKHFPSTIDPKLYFKAYKTTLKLPPLQ